MATEAPENPLLPLSASVSNHPTSSMVTQIPESPFLPFSASVSNHASSSTSTQLPLDEEITILHTTPFSSKSGATKSAAISVEDYHRTATTPIYISLDDDDELALPSSSRKGKQIYRGESSKSIRRRRNDAVLRRSFTCEICTEEKPVSDSFPLMGCAHSYCSQCISQYVAAKLQDNITKISCPAPLCGGWLEPHHCRTILPEKVFERWGDALCEAMILGAERFYCPYKDCSALLIDDGDSRGFKESECPECHRLFCVACKVTWHSGITCGEFQKLGADERSREDIMLRNLAMSKRWMRCPRCQFYISKSQGCNSMLCRCGHLFCYKCGVPATYDHLCQGRYRTLSRYRGYYY